MAERRKVAAPTVVDAEAALDLAREVEMLAEQYIKTLQIGGGPILSEAAMAEVLAKFSTYGQQGKPPGRKARPRKA